MKTLKLTLLSLASIALVSSIVVAGGFRFGMTGAVKAQVEELDKKVKEKKATTTTTTAPKVSFVITSVKEGSSSSAPSLLQKAPSFMRVSPFDVIKTSFSVNPATSYGWINSGAPDYIKVTLKSIEIRTSPTSETWAGYYAWTGSKELTIDGSGNVDTTGIELAITTGTVITAVRLNFATGAKIKGTLTGWFNISSPTASSYVYAQKTFYTRAAYTYDAVNHTGGATSYTLLESGPADETDVSLGGDNANTTSIELPVTNGNITTSTATLTIVMDLDRMLRFYNGLNTSGPNPADTANKAYFFCHTIFGGSVAAFIGTPGSIQGYKTQYASYKKTDPIGSTTPEGVLGWMSLIFDSEGNLITGMLIGDDDNALTVAKGKITSYSVGASSVTFRYDIDNGESVFEVTGFQKQTTLNYTTPVANWTQPVVKTGTLEHHGEAIYTLLFKR